MVLSVIPSFAATIVLENNPNYLNAPIQISNNSTGTYSGYTGYSGNTASFVLSNSSAVAEALGITIEKGFKVSAYNTGNNFDGLVVNGDVIYKGTAAVTNSDGSLVYEEDGTTVKTEDFEYNFKLIDAPVIGIRANGAGTALVIEINPDDYYDETGTAKATVHRRITAGKNQIWTDKFSNAVLSNKSQAKGTEYKTGQFPEGTIFISVTDFVNGADSVWPGTLANSTWNYNQHRYMIWDENNAGMKSGKGPSAFYQSKVAGAYDIWVMRADLDKTNGTTRGARFYIGDTVYASTQRPDDFAGEGAGDRYFFWSKQGSSVTLAKDEVFKVQLANQSDTYCRMAMIALVPSDASIDLPLTSADIYSGDTAISQDTAVALRSLYLNKVELSGDTVKATVNGKEYDVKATTVNTDIFGDALLVPTVYDAILAAGLTANADGKTADYITVNGKEIVNANKIKLNANDVITVSEATVSAFSPISVSRVFNTCGGGESLKLCMNPSGLHEVGLKFALTYAEDGSYVENETAGEGIIGAYLTGYLFRDTAYTQSGTNVVVPAGAKQAMTRNTHHQLYNYNTSQAGRLDVFVSNASYEDDPSVIVALPGSETEGAWRPFRMSGVPKLNKDYLYLVDSSTKFEVTVTKRDGKFALQSDGGVSATLYTVTYNDDETIKSTSVINDIIITPLTPYIGTVEDNQKVFVWESVPYTGNVVTSGILMTPLCAPITK